MDKYKPPFDITNKMLQYVSSISEKIGNITTKHSIETSLYLRKNNRIRSIHSSLKIEANSLSLEQARDVINGKIVLGEKKEIQEVKNAFKAYEKIKDINPYSLTQLKKYHGIMTKYTLDESGMFRSKEEGVFDGDRCIFMAPPPRFVPELMENLFNWMKANKDEVHPLILSAVFHYEFVFIHPFADGNGRMARLWHTALLTKWNSVFEYIPLESQIEKFQSEYYAAISRSHVEGKSNLFIEFILEQIDEVLMQVSQQYVDSGTQTTEYVKRIIAAMDYDVNYTATEIMTKLGIKSKETFRKNYLNPAMALNLVEMTLPDKPSSRNQRYVKR